MKEKGRNERIIISLVVQLINTIIKLKSKYMKIERGVRWK